MSRSSERVAGRIRRKKHIRKTVFGTPERPRLCVFKSGKHIYAQIIDDEAGHTVASASSVLKDLAGATGGNKDGAKAVGALIAKRALEANVTQVVFDRNGFKYHGRIAALADAAREGGLQF